MRELMRIIGKFVSILAFCSVIAGIIDRINEKKSINGFELTDKILHKPYGPYEKYFKRPLDFFLSSLALVMLSPVLLIIAILVRINLGSPIVFRQKRPGRDGEIFTLIKFRTMTDARDENGEVLGDDERVTKLGLALRTSSLDELLELWNIVKGEMSIIGPRPLLVEYLPAYTEEERHRHDVRPGLSGLAQVNGRNNASWEKIFHLDIEYVRKITFLGDLKILIQTIKKVVRREDVVTFSKENDEMLNEIRLGK